MKTVAITGLNGLIGRKLGEKIPSNYLIVDLYHNKKNSISVKSSKHLKTDLLKTSSISGALKRAKPDVVVHLAAITHIDKCQKDKKNGKKGKVWKINVQATSEIAKFCAKNKVHLVFLSTECVFDGKQEYFSEESKKNPLNWYGVTKSEAEDEILLSGAPATIIRSAVAYHEDDNNKTIYGKFLKDMRSGKGVKAVSDQRFTPTYTQDIITAIEKVVKKRKLGIFHVSSSKRLSPYDFAVLVARKNDIPINLIRKITLKKLYGSEKASLRLKNACLAGKKTNKILNFVPSSPQDIL